MDDLNTFGPLFESLAIRDLNIYTDTHRSRVCRCRESPALETDAVVELRDGRRAAFEIKMGEEKHIDAAARNPLRLKNKVSEQRQSSSRRCGAHRRGDGLLPHLRKVPWPSACQRP